MKGFQKPKKLKGLGECAVRSEQSWITLVTTRFKGHRGMKIKVPCMLPLGVKAAAQRGAEIFFLIDPFPK